VNFSVSDLVINIPLFGPNSAIAFESLIVIGGLNILSLTSSESLVGLQMNSNEEQKLGCFGCSIACNLLLKVSV